MVQAPFYWLFAHLQFLQLYVDIRNMSECKTRHSFLWEHIKTWRTIEVTVLFRFFKMDSIFFILL